MWPWQFRKQSARKGSSIVCRCRPEVEALEARLTPHRIGTLTDMPPVPVLPPPLPGSFTAAANGLPQLHSLPGAPVALYLDFDGGVSTLPNRDGSRGFEDIVYTTYDEDGDPNTFSALEQANIYEAWRQLSVYFAILNIDVTTVRPSPTTPVAWIGIGNNIPLGFAYIGSFSVTNDRATGFNPSGDARTRMSGIAHEAGHIFGLEHQSTYDLNGNKTAEYASASDPLHGPIMGIDYSGVVHKWSIGHPSDVYADLPATQATQPNSPATLQDDLWIVSGQIRRFDPAGDGYRADDHPGTMAAAIPLTVTGALQSAEGIIERLTDVDVFAFTSAGGTYSVAADRDVPSGVAIKLEVYDSAGTLVAAKAGPTNDQHLTLTLPAGTYYAAVSSQGNYGDLGAYKVSVRPMLGGWDTQDVGFLTWPGHAGYDSVTGAFHVGGAGADIGGSADNFRFVYQTLTGDGSITARVTAVENTNSLAKAGVMIRESLAQNSRHAMMALRPTAGAQFLRRTTAGGTTFTTSVSGPLPPYWVRLVRAGNTLLGYRSADGLTWALQGSTTIAMNSTVYIGLAVTSRVDQQNGAVNDAVFTNVLMTGNINPGPPGSLPAPTGLSLSLGSGTAINLSWNGVAGATGYAIDRSGDGLRWVHVATTGAAQMTFGDVGLVGSQRYFYRVSALDAAGRSAPSATASIVNRPSVPPGLTITTWNQMTILNWRDVSGETGYRIEQSVDGSNWTVLGLVDPNVPSFTDPVPILASHLSYRVIATGPAGESLASNVVSRLPTLVNLAPTITEPASASPNPVAGLTTDLSVAAVDDGGDANLVYLWSTSSKPAGAPYPVFTRNNSSDARSTTATFFQAGVYTFSVTVSDTGGRTATSSVTVTVEPTLSRIAISPGAAFVAVNGTQQFTAQAFDQFGHAMAPQPTITWAVTAGGGTISAEGLYTAPGHSGQAQITAANGDVSDTVPVTVVNNVPSVATPAAASPSPVTGTTTTLTVLGDDDGGEVNLTYTWEATGVPPDAIAPTFSANGTNAAKSTVATFYKAGVYTFLATIRDGEGVSTTSSVTVTVEQTLTRVVVAPGAASVVINTTLQFTAVARDQFNFDMERQPAFTWSVSGVGTIDATGLYAAPGDAGRATVTAAGGGVSGLASLTVLLPAPSNLTATALPQGRVQLKWKDNCTNEDGFYIETSVDGITWTLVAVRGPSSGGGNNATFVTDLFPPGRRYFRVRAFNANGTSGWSNLAEVIL